MKKRFNHIFWLLTEEEIDLINVLMHVIEHHDQILTPPKIGLELELNRCITTNMHEISASLGFNELKITQLLSTMDQITTRVATIYYDINGGRQMEKATFLNKYTITSTTTDINKRITLWINSDLITILQENTYLFENFYKHAEFELKGKYSTIIYDYFTNKGHGSKTFDIEEFTKIVDYDLIPSTFDWSKLNSNVLKRATKEINEKTDLHVDYHKIKNKIEGRIQATQVQINYYTSGGNKFSEFFKQDILMQRKVDYYIEKYVQDKYKQVTQFKDKSAIADPEAYIEKLRREALKHRAEFEAKIMVQNWSNVIKYEFVNEDGYVGILNYKNHEFITINNDYRLIDPMTNEILSTSARDTLSKINAYFEQEVRDGFTIANFPKLKHCSISYSKG